jgi:hypothetical protein
MIEVRICHRYDRLSGVVRVKQKIGRPYEDFSLRLKSKAHRKCGN